MFNDEITLFYHPSGSEQKKPVSLNRTGIAWDSDKRFKFKNPSHFNATSEMWTKYVKPKGKEAKDL